MGAAVLFDLRGLQSLPDVRAHGGGEYVRAIFDRVAEKGLLSATVFAIDPRSPVTDYLQGITTTPDVTVLEIDRDSWDSLPDVWERATYYSPLPYRAQSLPACGRRIVTVHGIRPIELPTDLHEWRFRSWREMPNALAKRLLGRAYIERQRRRFRNLIEQLDELIVPSEHTRFALLREFPFLHADRIHVCYSPRTRVSRVKPADSGELARLGVEHGRFILMVSGGRFEKNSFRGLRAIANLRSSHPEILSGYRTLVAGGLPRWVGSEMRAGVIEAPYVTEELLARLYRSSALFLYPSLNEGFGYPPLEALSHGAAVAAAAVCSMPEILDGCGVYWFDPRNAREMEARILQALVMGPRTGEEATATSLRAVQERQRRDVDKQIEMLWQIA